METALNKLELTVEKIQEALKHPDTDNLDEGRAGQVKSIVLFLARPGES